jgi:hypothetical protein
MALVFDPVSSVLLACILVELLRERARRAEAPPTPGEKSAPPVAASSAPVPEPQNPAPVLPIVHRREDGTVEIVRILPEGGYLRTGMVRQVGHPDIAEALKHESLAVLRSDGNIEITPGEIEVAPNVS